MVCLRVSRETSHEQKEQEGKFAVITHILFTLFDRGNFPKLASSPNTSGFTPHVYYGRLCQWLWPLGSVKLTSRGICVTERPLYLKGFTHVWILTSLVNLRTVSEEDSGCYCVRVFEHFVPTNTAEASTCWVTLESMLSRSGRSPFKKRKNVI